MLYSYEFCNGGTEWNMLGLGNGLRPTVLLFTFVLDPVRDKDVLGFLRLDVEILLLFDKVVFRLFNFFLFDELTVERLDTFRAPLECFFREAATMKNLK